MPRQIPNKLSAVDWDRAVQVLQDLMATREIQLVAFEIPLNLQIHQSHHQIFILFTFQS
jgi:hypothetical protein